MARLVAAMSGGVDSAVAAALAMEQGHEVTGVHMALLRTPLAVRSGARGCCSIEDANDARRVADALGIPFYVWDLSPQFEREVVQDFLDEYAAGRTPNPCLRCNATVKFDGLLARALALGFDGIVTGHYGRIVRDASGAVELHRGVDQAKDQSYVLGVLTQEQLRRTWLPLGELTKPQVRAMAAQRGLRVADKPDSSDVCFIPDGDTAGWLRERLGERPGLIEDESGRALGRHSGTYGFTIGQRKGLRLREPAADGEPRYVTRIEAPTSTVVVGPHRDLEVDRLTGGALSWCQDALVGAFSAGVQVRAHSPEVPATVAVAPDGLSVEVTFDRPLFWVAPGQTAVLYDGTRVIGAARIEATARAAV